MLQGRGLVDQQSLNCVLMRQAFTIEQDMALAENLQGSHGLSTGAGERRYVIFSHLSFDFVQVRRPAHCMHGEGLAFCVQLLCWFCNFAPVKAWTQHRGRYVPALRHCCALQRSLQDYGPALMPPLFLSLDNISIKGMASFDISYYK